MPDILAQKDLRRAASFFVLGLGAGAFKLEPVSLLYFARPLAVSPAPFDTGSFSPRPTAKDTVFFAMLANLYRTVAVFFLDVSYAARHGIAAFFHLNRLNFGRLS